MLVKFNLIMYLIIICFSFLANAEEKTYGVYKNEKDFLESLKKKKSSKKKHVVDEEKMLENTKAFTNFIRGLLQKDQETPPPPSYDDYELSEEERDILQKK